MPKRGLQHLLYFSSILLLLLSSPVMAQDIDLQPDHRIELSISSSEPTRLFMEGDRLVDLFVFPQEAAHLTLHQSGSLFLLPLTGKGPLFLTLIGESGQIQDLKLHLIDQPSEPIKIVVPQPRSNDEA